MAAQSPEEIIEAVAARAEQWRTLDNGVKLGLLRAMKENLAAATLDYATGEARVRGFDLAAGVCTGAEGEQFNMGPAMLGQALNKWIETYTALTTTGAPPAPVATREVEDYTVCTVYPGSALEKVVAGGLVAEVWTRGGATQGKTLREGHGVCGVLGAGNYSPPIDVFTKMFGENKVVIFKPHPNQVPLEGVLRGILAPLIEPGYLGWIDPQQGPALVNSKTVSELLMTGGCATYDAIVWGPGAEGARNKSSGRMKVSTPFEAELGGVGPHVIVPGRYTEKELNHQAAQLAQAKAINSGFVCASPQVIVVERSWPQRAQFLDLVRRHLARITPPPAYYPGAAGRHASFRETYVQAEEIRPANDGVYQPQLPTLLIPNVEPDSKEKLICEEAFCPVLGETALDAPLGADGSPEDFLNAAADFCNNKLFGSLSSVVIIDDRTIAAHRPVFDAFLAKMEYGAIGVNTWTSFNVFLGVTPWGAFPKHTAGDIQSGIGKIQNICLYDNPVKGIVMSPCVIPMHLQPPDRTARLQGSRLAGFMVNPGWWNLVKVISAKFTGL